jgi:hypothetical protein
MEEEEEEERERERERERELGAADQPPAVRIYSQVFRLARIVCIFFFLSFHSVSQQCQSSKGRKIMQGDNNRRYYKEKHRDEAKELARLIGTSRRFMNVPVKLVTSFTSFTAKILMFFNEHRDEAKELVAADRHTAQLYESVD